METLKNSLLNLDALLDKTIANAWPLSTEGRTTAEFAEGANTIANAIAITGEDSFLKLNGEDVDPADADLLKHYVYNYRWPEQAKSFIILWRNILFELLKSKVFLEEKKIEPAVHEKLLAKSEEVLLMAAKELKAIPIEEMQAIRESAGGVKKQLAIWQLQQNPWPTYKEQIIEIGEQCSYLQGQYNKLMDAVTISQQIKALVNQTLDSCTAELDDADAKAKDTISLIEGAQDNGKENKLPRLITRLEELEEETRMVHHLNAFGNSLDKLLDQLPEKEQVPLEADGGMLNYKEINFRKIIRQWLGSEVLPLLYEVWEQTELTSNSLKMSLVNIRNRLLLLSSEEKEVVYNVKEIVQPLQNFLKKGQAAQEELRKLRLLIKKRMNSQFQMDVMFNPSEEFLPLPLQSTINNFRFTQNKVWQDVQNWFRSQLNFFYQFRSHVEHEEALSVSEKVVLFVKSRQADPANSNYTSIFMTKGFIGESFWVGRERELAHIKDVISNWREGFRGSAAITGQRFSGKSLYGELVSHRYFPHNTIRLRPLQLVDIKGRKITADHDLAEVLDFVIKHTLNERPLIWLDDLELWSKPEIPLSKNLRALRKVIDDHGSRIFFMVSMSNWLKAHLHKMQDIERMFQSEINMDYMPIEKINEAILIRHGATHKILADEEGNELSPQVFQQMIRRIHKVTKGNIGDALTLWSASIHKLDEEHVVFDPTADQQLPDFLANDTALLLSTIMMEKRTTEYRLRKLLGPVFSEKYGGLLQRLFSMGLLTRQLDGWLEVSEPVANELGRQLEVKDYIKFYY